MAVQSVTSAYHKTPGLKILWDENWKNYNYTQYMLYICLWLFVWYASVYVCKLCTFTVMFTYFNVMYVLLC